jgi:hypothetical protein
MGKIAIYVMDQKVYGPDYGEFDFDGPVVHALSPEDKIVFLYHLRPGQYGRVQTLDFVEVLKINE